MDDLISRADAIRLIRNELEFLGSRETNAAVLVLEKMPSALKIAHWAQDDEGYHCTECNWEVHTAADPECYGLKCCPNCGSKMQ